MTPLLALDHLWSVAGCDPALLDYMSIEGDDPALPPVFRVGTLASASIAAMALAAADCFRLRTGRMQHVDVSVRRALIAFRSERYLRVNDGLPPELRHPVTGFYATRDGRWIQLHTNFPHHLQGVLKVLGCDGDPGAVAEAIRGWDGAQLDQTGRDLPHGRPVGE